MTDTEKKSLQEKLVELSFKRDELKAKYEEFNTQLEEVLTKLGLDYVFEDKQGTVYKVVTPKGAFVSFKHIDYVRTKRGDEKAGTLSLKEANEWRDKQIKKTSDAK